MSSKEPLSSKELYTTEIGNELAKSEWEAVTGECFCIFRKEDVVEAFQQVRKKVQAEIDGYEIIKSIDPDESDFVKGYEKGMLNTLEWINESFGFEEKDGKE